MFSRRLSQHIAEAHREAAKAEPAKRLRDELGKQDQKGQTLATRSGGWLQGFGADCAIGNT